MNSLTFSATFFKTLVSAYRVAEPHNVDPFRFPSKQRPDPVGTRSSVRALLSILRRSGAAAASGTSLSDEASKELLLDLCAFRVLGGRHHRLPRNDSFYWTCVESVKNLVVDRAVSQAGNYELDLYRIEGASGPIELEAHPMNILNTFLIQEYRLARGETVVEAMPGDVVIDGGGCWGDTALYFADRIGTGKVFVFEFDDENLAVLRRNLARNPRLAERIEIVERALWNSTAEVTVSVNGPATKVVDAHGSAATHEVRATSIDDWVEQAAIPRVDFIKMDIEGAEVFALDGAKRTIQSFAPRLAISSYHSIADLVTMPALVDSLRSDYEIFLSHATIHHEETIVFARAPLR